MTTLTDAKINEITQDTLGKWPSFSHQSWACKVVHAVRAQLVGSCDAMLPDPYDMDPPDGGNVRPLELAKEAVATAKENAALRQRVHELETELFWMKARERDDVLRLEFMINEECCVYSLTLNSGTRYRLGWSFDEQHQAEWYASPREAIDAQIAIQRGLK